MLSDVRHRLRPVRRRLQHMRLLRAAMVGLSAGVGLGIVAAVLWRSGVLSVWWPAVAAGPAGALLAVLLRALCPPGWHVAAAAVDAHCGLKDRAVTALGFAADLRDDPLRRMQVRETLDHLDRVDARAVVARTRSPWTPAAGGLLAVLLGVLLIPIAETRSGSAPVAALPVVLEQANQLEATMLEEMRELAEREAAPELQSLVDELETLVAELREPEVDQREALATLSEMQQALHSAMGQFDLREVDTVMQEIAAGMEAAEAMRPIAEDLKAGDYDAAADQLEKVDPEKLTQKERRAVADSLKRLAEGLEKGQQGELSEATSQMAEGLKTNNRSECNGGACKLAGLCRKQALRKKVSDCLSCQLNRLSMCKGACQGSRNGGNSLAKSDSPKNTWGKGQTNQPTGDEPTQIDSSREQVDVAGAAGDGPSEREIVTAPEARQQAARGYRERYDEFRKQAEAVLDSEPLPLGYRRTVQTYFESIRPTAEEAVEAADEPDSR